jgi:thiamine biosynthesis lipoprotein
MTPGRRQWLRWALVGAAGSTVAGSALAGQAPAGLVWRERALIGFGTTLWLRAGHADGDHVDRALDEVVALLRHLEHQMSLFDPTSAVCRLNRDGVLAHPDPALVDLLQQARQVSARSQGAFDITVQPLWAVWRAAQAQGRTPTTGELAAARARVDWRAVSVSAQALRLGRPGMALTLNGIAQGYAAERARALLRRHGIPAALLDTGEWAPIGQAPDGQAWRLGLASPRDSARILTTLQADGRAIAVSSDAHQRFGTDPGNDRDHHIIDPRSGRSPPHLSAVVVAANSATLADALTKVMFMGTAAQALQQARHWGVDVVAVDKAGRLLASSGWA